MTKFQNPTDIQPAPLVEAKPVATFNQVLAILAGTGLAIVVVIAMFVITDLYVI